MLYRAQVTLRNDALGLHLSPAKQILRYLSGIDAQIFFARGEQEFEITGMLALITASATLSLTNGAEFVVRCEGPQRAIAFQALQECFTSGHFEGDQFQILESPTETANGNESSRDPLC